MDDLTPDRPQPTTPTPPPATERIPTPSMSRPTPIDNGWNATAPVQPRRAKSTRRPPAITPAQPAPARPTAISLNYLPLSSLERFLRPIAILVLTIWPWVLAHINAPNDRIPWLLILLTNGPLALLLAVGFFSRSARWRLLANGAAVAAAISIIYLALRTDALSDHSSSGFDFGIKLPDFFLLLAQAVSIFSLGPCLYLFGRVLRSHHGNRPPIPPSGQRATPTTARWNLTPGHLVEQRGAQVVAAHRHLRRSTIYILASLPILFLTAWFFLDIHNLTNDFRQTYTEFLRVVDWIGAGLCIAYLALIYWNPVAFGRLGFFSLNTVFALQLAVFGLCSGPALGSITLFLLGCAALPCLACSFTALGWQLESARYPRMLIRPGLQDPVSPDDFQLDSGTWDEAKPRGRT